MFALTPLVFGQLLARDNDTLGTNDGNWASAASNQFKCTSFTGGSSYQLTQAEIQVQLSASPRFGFIRLLIYDVTGAEPEKVLNLN